MDLIARSATLSRDGRYRYRLERRWASGGAVLPWVMLNPSRADALVDDPTIRRVTALSRGWGFDGCVVVNLFGYRTASPAELASAPDPVGARNRRVVRQVLATSTAGVVVAAWGAAKVPGLAAAAASVLGDAGERGLSVAAVGRNLDGSPRHPLYVRRGTPLTRFGDGEHAYSELE
jgi:hypothetical protein